VSDRCRLFEWVAFPTSHRTTRQSDFPQPCGLRRANPSIKPTALRSVDPLRLSGTTPHRPSQVDYQFGLPCGSPPKQSDKRLDYGFHPERLWARHLSHDARPIFCILSCVLSSCLVTRTSGRIPTTTFRSVFDRFFNSPNAFRRLFCFPIDTWYLRSFRLIIPVYSTAPTRRRCTFFTTMMLTVRLPAALS